MYPTHLFDSKDTQWVLLRNREFSFTRTLIGGPLSFGVLEFPKILNFALQLKLDLVLKHWSYTTTSPTGVGTGSFVLCPSPSPSPHLLSSLYCQFPNEAWKQELKCPQKFFFFYIMIQTKQKNKSCVISLFSVNLMSMKQSYRHSSTHLSVHTLSAWLWAAAG